MNQRERDELDITPTSAADQLALLADEAARKHAKITVHSPITGTYFTLVDTRNDVTIGRYNSLTALEDAIGGIDEPGDQRDAAR